MSRRQLSHQQSKQNILNEDPARILINLLKLLMVSIPDSQLIINYIQKYQIDPNCYLPSIHGTAQLPIIFYCCSNSHLGQLFMYLMDQNVNLMLPIVCEEDTSQQIELLYYSQIEYIPILVEKGCQLNPDNILPSCEKLLIKGNIVKLMTLYKCGAINKKQLLDVTQKPGLIFDILDHLYERIFQLCQQNYDDHKLLDLTNEIMKNYVNTFKLFFKNGISVNQIANGQSFLQKVLNTYFIDLVKLILIYHPDFDNIDILHYSNFEISNRQVMKIYYNNETYQQINELIKNVKQPQKINKKKPIIKKQTNITN